LALSGLNGTSGFRLDGVTSSDKSGRVLSGVGDVNGDGYADFIVGAFGAESNGSGSGSSYVVFGDNWTSSITLAGTTADDELTGTAAGAQDSARARLGTWAFGRVVSPQTRPLRVGYLSADFRAHPVGFFMTPILEHDDSNQIQVTCYANSAAEDDVTRRLKQVVPSWHNCQEWSDEQLASQIRTDQIDILVDLIGYTGNNRASLLAMTMKPAPMQALYLGYPFSSGLPTIFPYVRIRA
jgi:hypothetical protein